MQLSGTWIFREIDRSPGSKVDQRWCRKAVDSLAINQRSSFIHGWEIRERILFLRGRLIAPNIINLVIQVENLQHTAFRTQSGPRCETHCGPWCPSSTRLPWHWKSHQIPPAELRKISPLSVVPIEISNHNRTKNEQKIPMVFPISSIV